MNTFRKQSKRAIRRVATNVTDWIGSTNSIVVHTILFLFAFGLYFLGINFDKILLIVTTLVSLEAIYLAIFIQMSVNKQARDLEEIQKDVDEIQEDVEGIEKDVDEIQEDVEEIQEDDEIYEKKETETLNKIENILERLMTEVSELKKGQSEKNK